MLGKMRDKFMNDLLNKEFVKENSALEESKDAGGDAML